MTKEIIINVSGCRHLDKNSVNFLCKEVDGEYNVAYCNEKPNCYYKQLKRLEQKLEKIEEAITTCLTFHTCQKCKFYNECKMSLEEFILEVIRGEENE